MGLFCRVSVQSFDGQSRNRQKVMGLYEIRSIVLTKAYHILCPALSTSTKIRDTNKASSKNDEDKMETRHVVQGWFRCCPELVSEISLSPRFRGEADK